LTLIAAAQQLSKKKKERIAAAKTQSGECEKNGKKPQLIK
jgi:hypothetical protein